MEGKTDTKGAIQTVGIMALLILALNGIKCYQERPPNLKSQAQIECETDLKDAHRGLMALREQKQEIKGEAHNTEMGLRQELVKESQKAEECRIAQRNINSSWALARKWCESLPTAEEVHP